MNNFLEKIASVEISTVIVEEIVDEVFIPWEVYRSIYYISRETLATSEIDPSLRDRYLQLRRQLELEYSLLLIDRTSALYDHTAVTEVKANLPLLAESNSSWETIATRLPEPVVNDRTSANSKVKRLLSDRTFLATLSKLGRIKATLDRRNRSWHQNSSSPTSITDTTYARTFIDLDGKIVNQYTQKILNRSDCQRLLQLHQQSVTAGEKHWRELLKFVLDFLG